MQIENKKKGKSIKLRGLSAIKYKRSQVADSKKKIREIDKAVYKTLQSQGNHLNQCYRIRTTQFY